MRSLTPVNISVHNLLIAAGYTPANMGYTKLISEANPRYKERDTCIRVRANRTPRTEAREKIFPRFHAILRINTIELHKDCKSGSGHYSTKNGKDIRKELARLALIDLLAPHQRETNPAQTLHVAQDAHTVALQSDSPK